MTTLDYKCSLYPVSVDIVIDDFQVVLQCVRSTTTNLMHSCTLPYFEYVGTTTPVTSFCDAETDSDPVVWSAYRLSVSWCQCEIVLLILIVHVHGSDDILG